MNWLIQRYSDDGNSTLGLLFRDTYSGYRRGLEFFCHILEDEFRKVKVKGETRIPAGRYELKILKVETPLTLKHRKAYGNWFKFHVEVTNVPNFTGIYFHSGNADTHTDGCLLPGFGNEVVQGMQKVTHSRLATKAFYDELYPYLDNGGTSFLEIRDEHFLLDNISRNLTEDKLI